MDSLLPLFKRPTFILRNHFCMWTSEQHFFYLQRHECGAFCFGLKEERKWPLGCYDMGWFDERLSKFFTDQFLSKNWNMSEGSRTSPSCGPWLIISKSISKCIMWIQNSRFLSCHFCECKTEAVTAHMMMNPGQYRLSIWPSNVGGFLSGWCSPSYSCFPFDRNPLFT